MRSFKEGGEGSFEDDEVMRGDKKSAAVQKILGKIWPVN